MLVDGSAPKPLITRAKLCGYGRSQRRSTLLQSQSVNKKIPMPGAVNRQPNRHRGVLIFLGECFCEGLFPLASSPAPEYRYYV